MPGDKYLYCWDILSTHSLTVGPTMEQWSTTRQGELMFCILTTHNILTLSSGFLYNVVSRERGREGERGGNLEHLLFYELIKSPLGFH